MNLFHYTNYNGQHTIVPMGIAIFTILLFLLKYEYDPGRGEGGDDSTVAPDIDSKMNPAYSFTSAL